MRETIERLFKEACKEQGIESVVASDDLVLLESGLDSIGFAMIVTRLEEELGFDPFSSLDQPYYPRTFGELVSFYEKHQS